MPKILTKIVIGAVLLAILLFIWSKAPAVPKDYQKQVKTGGEIEAKYLQNGEYTAKFFEKGALQNFKKYNFWYPSEIASGDKKFPVVIFANGTGVSSSKHPAIFEHWATHGFIAVGTEEEFSWNGFGTELSLKTLRKLHEHEKLDGYEHNPFYGKVDFENVAVVGHSQGGVGVFSSATKEGNPYKTAIALSPTNELLAIALDWNYDASKIKIPTLLISGTGPGDENLVVSLDQLKSIYNNISEAPFVSMVRRSGADHSHTLFHADGYVTAWLSWQLKGDNEASKAFVGDNPEIKNNQHYQDFASKTLTSKAENASEASAE